MKKYRLITILAWLMIPALLLSCGGKTTTTSAGTPTTAATTAPPGTTTPAATSPAATTTAAIAPTVSKGYMVASRIAYLFYDLNAVNNYYDNGLIAMASFKVGAGLPLAVRPDNGAMTVAYYTTEQSSNEGIPPEYLDKIPPDGSIPAPPGACPAGAKPDVTFITDGGDPVTPELIKEKVIEMLPVDLLNTPFDEPGSLLSLFDELVPPNDMRLADPEGWNELLWDKIRDLQEPAESLMDYQMWNVSEDIERQVIAMYRQGMVDKGVPPMIIDAFDESALTGWYSSTLPAAEDALAQMDIIAEMTGTANGQVYEWRDFDIPGMGEAPEFGVQRGEGTVTSDIPDIGPVDFSVDIWLDKFDEQGRAIQGTVIAKSLAHEGYEVSFTFQPDGSKDGVVYKDGEPVGELSMTVDAEKFENYIDIKEGTEIKLPEEGLPNYQ